VACFLDLDLPEECGGGRAGADRPAGAGAAGRGASFDAPRVGGDRPADRSGQLFVCVHNEYLQVAAELGLVGLVLLAILLVTIKRMLWRACPTGRPGTTWAGVVAAVAAFAVHSGFDFVWHLPAIVLTVALSPIPIEDAAAAEPGPRRHPSRRLGRLAGRSEAPAPRGVAAAKPLLPAG
jgi:hypothetical protein